MEIALHLAKAGLEALQEYIIYHSITCLIAAFLLAGAVVRFVSKEAIIQYLGHAANKLQAFTIAALGSFAVAACSCTVIPVAAGVYYGGGAVGPAFIILWVAPAANILALVYTGAILGQQMVLARLVAALLMAGVVGSVMSFVFQRSEKQRALEATEGNTGPLMTRSSLVLILLLVATLLGPNYLVGKGPFEWKVVVTAVGLAVTALWAIKTKARQEIREWLRESWWFVRLILPLLLLGVFLVGIIGALLPEAWVQRWLSGASLRASFLATMIGAVSYFATMTEAPFVDKLMSLGMGKGPALALLLTGPGLSLPNWLAIARVFGVRKAVVYVCTLIVLGTLVGWIAGNWLL